MRQGDKSPTSFCFIKKALYKVKPSGLQVSLIFFDST